MPPKQSASALKEQKAKDVAAKKEKEGIDPKTGKLEISKHMNLVLKDYERRCDVRKIFIFPPIKRHFREAIEEHMALTKIAFYPTGDRKAVLDFPDSCKVLLTSKEAQDMLQKERERAHKELMRTLRKDDTNKGPACLSPLLEAVRSKCYTYVETLFVWGFHMNEQESATLAAMLATGKYRFRIICLYDCLLMSPCLNIIAENFQRVSSLTEVVLDFNPFGDEGAQALSKWIVQNRSVTLLSMRYCNLTEASGIPISDIVRYSPVVNIFLDGNDLTVSGIIPIIGVLSDFAKHIRMYGDPRGDDFHSTKKSKKKGRKKGKAKGGTGVDYPIRGSFLNRLTLTHTGLEHIGLSRTVQSMVCFRLIATVVSLSPDIQELDFFGNDVGEIGANMIYEALKLRIENKLPVMAIRIGPKLASDTVANIIKLAPGQKKKKGGKKKK